MQQILNLNPSAATLSQFNYAYNPAGEITQWQQKQNSANTHLGLGYDLASQLIAATSDSGSLFKAYISGTPHAGDVVSVTAYDASLTSSSGQETASYTVQSGDSSANIASGLASAIGTAMSNISVTASATGSVVSISTSPNFCTQFRAAVTGTGATDTITISGSSPIANLHKQFYYNYDLAGNRIGVQGDSTGSFPTGLTTTATKYSYNNVNELTGISAGGPIRFQATTTNPVKSAVVNVTETAAIGGTVTAGNVLTLTVHDKALSGPRNVNYTVLSGDTTSSIATGLKNAINADSTLSAIGVTATSSGAVITISSSSVNVTSYTSSLSSGATETISLGSSTADQGFISPSTAFTANPTLASGANTASATAVSGGGTPATNTYPITISSSASQTVSSDANGNMTSDGTNFYSWDAENRLVKVKYPYGTPSVSSTITAGSNPEAIAITPDGTKCYVANMLSGTVSVINTSTNTVSTTVSVGSYPYAVAMTPDGSKLYVANIGDSTVSVINTSSNTVVATVTVGSSPVFLAASPDSSKVYVSDLADDTVSAINTATNTVAATISVGFYPDQLAITPDGSKVYVPNSGEDTVSVINTSTNTVSTTVTVGNAPGSTAITPDGSKAYVANSSDGTVSVINTSTNAVAATIGVGSDPFSMVVMPDSSKVYVGNEGGTTVSVINTASNTVSSTITVGTNPYTLAMMVDGTNIYVANVLSNNIKVINTKSDSVTATVSVGSHPYSVAITPDGTKAYVPNASSGNVSAINTAPNNTQLTIDGNGRWAKLVETTSGSVSSTKQFVWCGSDTCETRDASGAVTAQFFPWGEIVGGTSYYYEKDHLGNIVGLVNSSGTEVTSIRYDAFGVPTVLSGTVIPDFGYAGMYLHQRSGLNLTMFRAYSAPLGRWLSRDPIGEVVGTNLFAYVANNPISFVDPSGLDKLFIYGGIGGLHRGLYIERDDGSIITINGGYTGSGLRRFTGDLKVEIRDDQKRPTDNPWSPVNPNPISTDKCKINRLLENARRLQNRLQPQNRPVKYSIFVPALSGGRTSNQVVPLLLDSVGIPVPPEPRSPGYDIPFDDTDPGLT